MLTFIVYHLLSVDLDGYANSRVAREEIEADKVYIWMSGAASFHDHGRPSPSRVFAPGRWLEITRKEPES